MFVNKMSVRKVSSFLEDEKVEVYPTFFGILRRCSMEGGGGEMLEEWKKCVGGVDR